MSIFTGSLLLIVGGLVGLIWYFWQHAQQARAYLAEQRKKDLA